jgi:asparagine synthase (glutamine-hydrolysing)
MCGIYSVLNYTSYKHHLSKFLKITHRGPDDSSMKEHKDHNILLGFHRLSINGLSQESNQPMYDSSGNIILLCNGQIYNHNELFTKFDFKRENQSDCEIIIHLYKMFGIEYTLHLLDGVFGFILLDLRNNTFYVARDPLGVRPLFIGRMNDEIVVSSELKALDECEDATPVTPGTWTLYERPNGWKKTKEETYFSLPLSSMFPVFQRKREMNVLTYAKTLIRNALISAVEKRVRNTDRPLACLLSGGLDSSLVASITASILKTQNKVLHTYCIGLEGSEDIEYAKKVAKHIGSQHTTVIKTEQEFLDAIPEVIYAIESYDVTTIRASVGNYLVAKYIKEHSDHIVILNGDGSDELFGGYLYMHEAPNEYEFDKEIRRLLREIHYFDVLRSDRSISAHGLEARTPFLDKNLVSLYLSLPRGIRYYGMKKQTKEFKQLYGEALIKPCEKWLLRSAFKDMNLLPTDVLWRQKEAFSDGVSHKTRSWFEIIQEKHKNEKEYYKELFLKHFRNHESIIPHYWMPRFVDATDASARTLKIYKED